MKIYRSVAAKLTQVSENAPLAGPIIHRALQRNNEENNGSYLVNPKIIRESVAVNITL
jgi:hypothetical protein